jgi:hypothetical protein
MTPLASTGRPPEVVPVSYYYKIPRRLIFRTYPVFAPQSEPIGYLDSLRGLEPIIEFDTALAQIDEPELTRLGGIVWDYPIFFSEVASEPDFGPGWARVRDSLWYKTINPPLAKNGIMPFYRYVVRKKGIVEVGAHSCATCHDRVLKDGQLIRGAQGNFPFERMYSFYIGDLLKNADEKRNLEAYLEGARVRHCAPWLKPDPFERVNRMNIREIQAMYALSPPGVMARSEASPIYPVKVPDIIGLRDRHYLDATGTFSHRSISDLQRYIILVQGANLLNQYGRHIRFPFPDASTLTRYGDPELRALATFVYSLIPPPNPNCPDSLSEAGKRIFAREKCGNCHTPPLYTNNRLLPVTGFRPSKRDYQRLSIPSVSIDTDPGLATLTRKGTGYYKVPSLRGLWYRSVLQHSGAAADLHEWFDPRRLEDGYRRKISWIPGEEGKIPGHRFGLDLAAEEKQSLIRFLLTL